MIEVSKLNFSYPGSRKLALSDLNFSVEPGEIFGFLGPSGAGKSTTQKILIGLLRGFEGEVRVLGKPLQSWRSDYYQQIGVSFELPNHYLKLTALENLHYFRTLYAGRTDDPLQVLESVGLEGDARKRVSDFSKGMRIRLNLARALLHRPKLLFLDEPTSGLDPVNSRRIKEIIRQKRQGGTTVFLTTHNMTFAEEVCDRVAFMVDGRIALIDRPSELKLRYGERTLKVEVGDGEEVKVHTFPLANLADNPFFLALLKSPHLRTVHSQESTLESIFIRVTGKTLESAA
ncbi:ABC transporter ATP-binding protein [uncultured Meiothermus sp.]|jgi:fluoroquinolone transport system ATP-binding protein|uniref:ABC transporter ATP-binding protein n=1 Tax=uncultured Meiothermus sp. TaxID=157471 RepID=UPI00260993BC|nr:ABC transporter ATP-binding protein [uncultured Meiothermus sp.]